MTETYNVVIKTGKSITKGISELFENIIDFIIAVIVLLPIGFILYKILLYNNGIYGNFTLFSGIIIGLIFILYLLICFFNNILYIIFYFFIPGIKISLNSNVLKPGETLKVQWEVKGIISIIKKLHIYLEENESTFIKDSNGSGWVDKKVRTVNIFEGNIKSEIASGEMSLKLPENIEPCHIEPNRRVFWTLCINPKKVWLFNIFYFSKYFGKDFGIYKYGFNVSGEVSNIYPEKPLYSAGSSKIIAGIFASLLMLCTIFTYKEMPDTYGITISFATGIISVILWISSFLIHNCSGCKKISLLSNNIEAGKYCSPECYFFTPTLNDEEYEKIMNKCLLCSSKIESKNGLCENCEKKNIMEIEKFRTMTSKEKKFIELTVSKRITPSLYNTAYLIIAISIMIILIYTTGTDMLKTMCGEITQNLRVIWNDLAQLNIQDKFLYYFTNPDKLIKPMEIFFDDFNSALNFLDFEEACNKTKIASVIMLIAILFLQALKYIIFILKPAVNIIRLWNDSMSGELSYIIAPLKKEKNGEVNYFHSEQKKWIVSDDLFIKYEGGKPCLFEYTKNSNLLIRINGEKIIPLQ